MASDLPQSYVTGMDSLFPSGEDSQKWGNGLAPEELDRAQRAISTAPDPEAMRVRLSNTAFLSAKLGLPVAEVSQNLEAYQHQFSQAVYKRPIDDPALFHDSTRAYLENGRNEQKLLQDATTTAYKEYLSGGDRLTWKTGAFLDMQGQLGYDREHLDYYHAYMDRVWDQMATKGWELNAPTMAVHTLLAASRQGAWMTLDPKKQAEMAAMQQEAISAVANLSPEDRDFVFDRAAAWDQQEKDERDDTRGTAGSRIAGAAANSIFQLYNNISSGLRQFIDQTTDALPLPTAAWRMQNHVDMRADEQWAESKRQVYNLMLGEYQRDAAKSGSASRFAADAAAAIPQVAAQLTPEGLALNYFAQRADAQSKFEKQGIAPSTAANMASASAIWQTATAFITGKLVGKVPGYERLVDGLKNGVVRYSTIGAADTVAVAAAMAGQHFGDAAVQDLWHTLDKSVPQADWKKYAQDFKDHAPSTAMMAVFYGLVGSGVAAFKDDQFGQRMLENVDHMRNIGFNAADAAYVARGADLDEKVKRLKEVAANRGKPGAESSVVASWLDTRQQTRTIGVRAAEGLPEKADFHREAIRTTVEQAAQQEGQEQETPEIERAEARETFDRLREQAEQRNWLGPDQRIERDEDGLWTVKTKQGVPFTKTQTPEMAYKVMEDHDRMADEAEMAQIHEQGRPDAGNPDALGFVAPGTQMADKAISSLGQRAKDLTSELYQNSVFTPYKKIVNGWFGRLQENAVAHLNEGEEIAKTVERDEVPSWRNPWPWARRQGNQNTTLSAMSLYGEAGGDKNVLRQWLAKSTKAETKRQLEAALNLTEEQIAKTKEVQGLFKKKFDEAVAWGIFDKEQWVQNYIPHLAKDEPDDFLSDSSGSTQITRPGGPIKNAVSFQQRRVHPDFVSGEQAGTSYKTKNLAKLWTHYASEVDKMIETKKAIKALTTMKGSDGRPLAAVLGSAKVVPREPGEGDPTIIKPFSKTEDTYDYRAEVPGLRKWKWLAKDAAGNPVQMEGILGLHPEIASNLKRVLGNDAISAWLNEESGSPMLQSLKAAAKFFERGQHEIKETMLGYFSPFHLRRISEQAALGYHVNVLDLPKVDPVNDPVSREWLEHGGVGGGSERQMQDLVDGLGSGGMLQKLLPYGEQAQQFSNWLFNEYIPRVGQAVYRSAKEANMKTYAKELASGKMTPEDVMYLSAKQSNYVTGYPNYADLARSKTLQHILRDLTLAPAFWEQNLRWMGSAMKGVAGAKDGRFAAKGLFYLAATQFIAARMINAALNDGDMKTKEAPFGLVYGTKIYSLRTLPVDLWSLTQDWRQFAKGRISPLLGSAWEFASRTNYRGEEVSSWEALKEFALRGVPISMRALPAVRDWTATGQADPLSAWEQFISTTGFTFKRKSTINESYQLARDWAKSQGLPHDTGVHPVSPYMPVRYALEDGNLAKAAEEIKKLRAKLGPDSDAKINKGVHDLLMRPWTGSAKNDKAFMDSLSHEDLLKVSHAQAERTIMYQEFMELLQGRPGAAKQLDERRQKAARDPAGTSFRQ